MSTPIAWPEAQRICDIPEVRETLDKFAADAHEENMLAMVSAIMGHASAQGRAAGLEAVADPVPDCPHCNGSGEEEVMDGDGPDAHPIMVNCTHCGGVGSLSAAYKHLLAELAIANSKYLDACGKLYFANLSPTPSDAGKDDPILATWPAEIWLQAGDEPLGHYSEYEDVTWCRIPQGESDVRYVRASSLGVIGNGENK